MTCPGSCSPDAGSSQHPFQTCQAVPGLYKLSSISSIPEIPSLEADPEHPFEKGVFLATRLFQQTLPGHLVLLIVTSIGAMLLNNLKYAIFEVSIACVPCMPCPNRPALSARCQRSSSSSLMHEVDGISMNLPGSRLSLRF